MNINNWSIFISKKQKWYDYDIGEKNCVYCLLKPRELLKACFSFKLASLGEMSDEQGWRSALYFENRHGSLQNAVRYITQLVHCTISLFGKKEKYMYIHKIQGRRGIASIK